MLIELKIKLVGDFSRRLEEEVVFNYTVSDAADDCGRKVRGFTDGIELNPYPSRQLCSVLASVFQVNCMPILYEL